MTEEEKGVKRWKSIKGERRKMLNFVSNSTHLQDLKFLNLGSFRGLRTRTPGRGSAPAPTWGPITIPEPPPPKSSRQCSPVCIIAKIFQKILPKCAPKSLNFSSENAKISRAGASRPRLQLSTLF